MNKVNQLFLTLALTIVVMVWLSIGAANLRANDPRSNPTRTATAEPTPAQPIEETPKPEEAFWAGALDIQQLSGGKCHFDVCQYLKITTTKTCSSITLFGATTKDSGKVIDYFEQNVKRLAKGKSRVVEFGTDPANSYENFVELQDALCWK